MPVAARPVDAQGLPFACRNEGHLVQMGPLFMGGSIDSMTRPSSHFTCLHRAAFRGSGRLRFATKMLCVGAVLALTGCDQLGIETPGKSAERQVAESKATGSACRHALRAIEDCYVLNPKADKAAVFLGWREMDEYMRENKLEGVVPVVPRPAAAAPSKPSRAASAEEDAEE